MHEALHEFLLELPAPDNGKSFLFPSLAGKDTGGKSGLSMAFTRIMEKARVRGEVVRERQGEKGRSVNSLSFHSFRHTLTGTFLKYENAINGFVTSVGNRAKFNVNQIAPRDVLRWRDAQIRDGKSPSTANDHVKIVRMAFTSARRQGFITVVR